MTARLPTIMLKTGVANHFAGFGLIVETKIISNEGIGGYSNVDSPMFVVNRDIETETLSLPIVDAWNRVISQKIRMQKNTLSCETLCEYSSMIQ